MVAICHVTQTIYYFFLLHCAQKLSHKIWFQMTNEFENWVTFTFDTHAASFIHLVECIYQLWDHMLQQFSKKL